MISIMHMSVETVREFVIAIHIGSEISIRKIVHDLFVDGMRGRTAPGVVGLVMPSEAAAFVGQVVRISVMDVILAGAYPDPDTVPESLHSRHSRLLFGHQEIVRDMMIDMMRPVLVVSDLHTARRNIIENILAEMPHILLGDVRYGGRNPEHDGAGDLMLRHRDLFIETLRGITEYRKLAGGRPDSMSLDDRLPKGQRRQQNRELRMQGVRRRK